MASAIKTNEVTKRYGPIFGVQDLNLDVPEGETFGFLGPNGSGKTTTIRMVTGFLKPSAGSITVLGYDAWKQSVAIKKRLGYLPDAVTLYPTMTGEQLLDYLAELQGSSPVARAELCERLQLTPSQLRQQVKTYSRGMKQKLALIQAFQHDPPLLILDEPTEGLDPLMQQAFFDLVDDLHRRGHTVFLSSHVLWEVERLCQRVAIIRQGRLVALATVAELQKQRVRTMEIVLAADSPEMELGLPCVAGVERNGRVVKLLVQGDITPLLRELARVRVEDMVYERSHLDEIFLDYYRERGPA